MKMRHSFSGHETFPLRTNWLKKAVDAIQEDKNIFRSDSAIAKFGVGKNMVRSIRHWSLTTGVIEMTSDSEGHNSLCTSDLGDYLLGEKGADPYCEDTATLWLIHWLICHSPYRASLWHYVFGHWRGGGIDLRSLRHPIDKWLFENGGFTPANSTLNRDLKCLINTYVARNRKNSHLENIIEFPLSSLGLLYENRGIVYLRQGQKSGLSPEIFAYAILDYWDQNYSGIETLSVQDIVTRQGSPGQIFLLSEEQIFDLVSRIEGFKNAPFQLDNTAGVFQVYRTHESTPQSMLKLYYSIHD